MKYFEYWEISWNCVCNEVLFNLHRFYTNVCQTWLYSGVLSLYGLRPYEHGVTQYKEEHAFSLAENLNRQLSDHTWRSNPYSDFSLTEPLLMLSDREHRKRPGSLLLTYINWSYGLD